MCGCQCVNACPPYSIACSILVNVAVCGWQAGTRQLTLHRDACTSTTVTRMWHSGRGPHLEVEGRVSVWEEKRVCLAWVCKARRQHGPECTAESSASRELLRHSRARGRHDLRPTHGTISSSRKDSRINEYKKLVVSSSHLPLASAPHCHHIRAHARASERTRSSLGYATPFKQ